MMFALETTKENISGAAEIERILVVDDEPEFVRTLHRHLRREGFSLYSATDGKDAVEQIERCCLKGAPIHLVVTDVLMPRMDGVDLMRWIKESHPEISVLVVSGFADTRTTAEIVRPEMDEYCQKPFTPGKMMSLLGRIREKRRNVAC